MSNNKKHGQKYLQNIKKKVKAKFEEIPLLYADTAEVCKLINGPYGFVSRALNQLERDGVLSKERKGMSVFYSMPESKQ